MRLARLFLFRSLPRSYLMLALLGFSLFTGMATGFGLFYRLVYMLALIEILAYLWTWLAVRRLAVKLERRTLQAKVGDVIEEQVSVLNQSRLPKIALEVGSITDLPGYAGGMVIYLRGRSDDRLTLQTHARKRGVYTLGPIRVSNTDPFNLTRHAQSFGETDRVTVYPKTYDLSGFELPPADLSGDASFRRRTHTVTPHASTVRDYAAGDSLSRVHWNSTARLGKLMSKEFDLGRSGEVWVLVDLYQSIQAGELEESTDEYAVSIGASLANRYLAANQPVGLIAYGGQRYYLQADTGTGQMDRIMQVMAMTRAEGTTSLDILIPNEEPSWSPHSSLVVITPSTDVQWVVALRELAKRGIRVAVVLVDPQSFGGHYSPLNTLEQLLQSGISTYVVRKGDGIPAALSRRYEDSQAPEAPRPQEAGVSG